MSNKNEKTRIYELLGLLVLMIFIVSTVMASDTERDEKVVKDDISDIPLRYDTYANDDCRFFSDRSLEVTKTQKGEVDDWMRITCTGVREYIHGINPKRCALVIVDLEGGEGGQSEDDFFQLCPDLGRRLYLVFIKVYYLLYRVNQCTDQHFLVVQN